MFVLLVFVTQILSKFVMRAVCRMVYSGMQFANGKFPCLTNGVAKGFDEKYGF